MIRQAPLLWSAKHEPNSETELPFARRAPAAGTADQHHWCDRHPSVATSSTRAAVTGEGSQASSVGEEVPQAGPSPPLPRLGRGAALSILNNFWR